MKREFLSPYSTEKRDPKRIKSTHTKINVHSQPKQFAAGTQSNLYSTNLRWGFTLGIRQIFGLAMGIRQILPFLDTDMFVSPMRNYGNGGLSQRKDPTRMVLRRSGIQALHY